MNRKIIRQLYKKEMLDVLRDKKTVIMMLIVPLLVYPLMFVVSLFMMTKVTTQMDTQTYRVGVDFAQIDEELLDLLLDPADDSYSFELFDVTQYSADTETLLRSESADAVLFVSGEPDGQELYSIQYMSSVTNSDYAEQKLADILDIYREQLTRELLTDAGLSADTVLEPIAVEASDQASTEESTGSLLGTIVPFMLVVSLLMGTMYPAIDTTAGERERGTLETILTLPVTNRELIFSKFLTVGTIGIVSAMLNMISMGGIGVYMYKLSAASLQTAEGIRLSRFLPAILVCCLCVLAFAVLISALSMCFCVFAKTYKEANNYITPLMLIVMFASFIGFLPNVRLTGGMTLVPVANICLLIRDLLSFKFALSSIALVLFSNIAYGVIAVLLLGRLYNSEAILFGNGIGGVRIFERRSNIQKGGVPSAGEAWLVIPVILVLIIYAGGYVSVKYIVAGLLVTQGMIAGVPLFAAWYTKRDLKRTFRLQKCRPGFFFGGVLLMIGTLLLGMILSSFLSILFPDSAADMTDSMSGVYACGFGVSLLLIALIPALCEELLFRGFLFSALENRMKSWTAIVITSLLFGLYHMNLVQSPTAALLGLALCYVSARSESLFPGVLMHFFNNALSVVTIFYPDEISHCLPFLSDGGISVWVLAPAGIVLGTAGVLMIKCTEKRVKNNPVSVDKSS